MNDDETRGRHRAAAVLSPPRHVRLWLYAVAIAALPLLVFYGLVSEDAAPLWLALAGAALAVAPPAVAAANVDSGPA